MHPTAVGPGDVSAVRAPLTFDRVYEEHVDFVWRTARRLGVQPAFLDDIVQNTFIIVLRKLAEFEGRSSLRTWLYGITSQVAREHRRSLRRKSPHWNAEASAPLEELATTCTGEDVTASREALRMVEHLLQGLGELEREVVVLMDLEGMSATEVASALCISPERVYSRLRAGRTALEKEMQRLRTAWRTP